MGTLAQLEVQPGLLDTKRKEEKNQIDSFC